jgi:hypothetical protein
LYAPRPRLPTQIHFRPILLEEYDDCIEFTTEKGVFVVPIRAHIPQMHSYVPTNLDFGFCPVQETYAAAYMRSHAAFAHTPSHAASAAVVLPRTSPPLA